MKFSTCKQDGKCFARLGVVGHGRCIILDGTDLYVDQICPFQKPEKEYTNGKYYPYDPKYKGT